MVVGDLKNPATLGKALGERSPRARRPRGGCHGGAPPGAPPAGPRHRLRRPPPSPAPPPAEGVDAVVCSTGTTAFPSKRWDGDNGPKETDLVAAGNLIRAAAAAGDVRRFVFVTSCGVDRFRQFGPFAILNAFGGERPAARPPAGRRPEWHRPPASTDSPPSLRAVLEYKKASEDLLKSTSLPWTILRPSRLTDGPYTSYDLNTLLQATSGTRQRVSVSAEDDLGTGQCSRIAVAEACVQALACGGTVGRQYAVETVEGPGPGSDAAAWAALFASV